MTLQGQLAAITGGGRGIGRAIAQALAKAGAHVVVLARTSAELDETVRLIPGARGMELDVTDAAAVTRVFAVLGPVDMLVNNAGYGGPLGPLTLNDADDWWRTFDVNVRGPMLCSKAVLPAMVARGKGRIVSTSSGAAVMAIPNFSAYVASKIALNKFIECLAGEVKDNGVSVFTISPGPVRTAMSESLLNAPDSKKYLPWFESMFETQMVPPELAADLVVRLAGGKYDALTGRFLSFDDDLDKVCATLPA